MFKKSNNYNNIYELHVDYIAQFMADFNINGMCTVNVNCYNLLFDISNLKNQKKVKKIVSNMHYINLKVFL